VVKAITHRKNGIFQYATIGCGHPWYTYNMLQLPVMEADLFGALKDSALDVLEVRADPAGLSNIAYAKIRKQGAGDAKQARNRSRKGQSRYVSGATIAMTLVGSRFCERRRLHRV
jgi:UbiD family decarboxylase